MNPKYKTPWIAALRSGRYQQTVGLLRGDGGHCCLGVLCDLANPSGWHLDDCTEEDRHALGEENELGSNGREEFGLTNEQEALLINMNDKGKSFAEIADYIEANL